MLADILNHQRYGIELWKVLVAFACLGTVSVVAWVAALIWIFRLRAPLEQKLLAAGLVIGAGPLSALYMLIILPLCRLLEWDRSRRQGDGTSHSQHVPR